MDVWNVIRVSLYNSILRFFNHVLLGGRNHVINEELHTSEEELSEDDTEEQDDESCIDVSGWQNFVARVHPLAPARPFLGRLQLHNPLCDGLHVRVSRLHRNLFSPGNLWQGNSLSF